MPSSLPANLIEVIPEVKVNGEVILSSDVMKLGEEIDVSMTPYIPGLGNIRKQTHTTIAGSIKKEYQGIKKKTERKEIIGKKKKRNKNKKIKKNRK